MNRHRILSALVALIAAGVVAAVIYLETSSSSSASSTTITTATITTLPSTTLPSTTLAPTTLAPATLAPTTEPPTTLPPTTLAPPDRALVPVVVSSGPSAGQRLAPATFLIGAAGWSDIRPLTGSIGLTETVVFFVDGMQAAAELLAADTGVPVTAIAPMAQAPPVAGLANAQLLYYFGGT